MTIIIMKMGHECRRGTMGQGKRGIRKDTRR
jgi:hypothetical protein